MAKIYDLFGSMTGKLADTVMSVRNGEQIARKYQPVVYNPSTPAQVAQRAKLKELSQLSAILAPVIAIPKNGPVSSRNLFTKVNFPSVSYENNTAVIDMTDVQLTKSSVGLPVVLATNTAGSISVSLGVAATGLARVVYVAIVRDTDNKLRLGGTVVVEASAHDATFAGTIDIGSARDAFVLAYGVRDNTETARVTFGNVESLTATDVAQLVVTRTLTETDITLTATVGATAFISAAKDGDDKKASKKTEVK